MKEKIPDYQTLMLPLMELLKDNQPHSLQEVLDYLAKRFELTEEELRILVPSGQQALFKNRVTWAISYLKNAGLLSYPKRAIYQITESGQTIFKENLTSITTAYLKKFDAYKSWQKSINEHANIPDVVHEVNEVKTPEEIIGENFNKINDKLGIELLEMIKQKTPAQFERFVLELLDKMGYGGVVEKNFEIVGQSGDNGIDGIIYQDKLGIDRIYVQAKKWTDNKVQSKEIRDFIGSLSLRGTNKGVFITTFQFTEDAMKTVKMNPQNVIILIDGKKLTDFAIQYKVGVQTKEYFEIKSVDIDFFEEL
ncbi:MAG: restriction endonuclease [Ginsengibacter sp.]